MNIVHLTSILGIGGLPNYLLQLARMSQAEFKSVTVAHIEEQINPKLEIEGLNIRHLRTVEDIRALKPDLLHVHLLSDLNFLQKLFTLNIPLVRTYHDYTSTCLRRGKRRWPGDRCHRPLGLTCAAFGCVITPPRDGSKFPGLADLPAKISERDAYRNFDASLTGSNHMTNMLLSNGYDPARVHMIPYFSSFEQEALIPRHLTPGLGTTRPLEILFTGQAVSGKGLEILIKSLANLKGEWRLTVYSEGPRLQPAKDSAAALGLANKISFRGWVNQTALREAYKQADIFVVPSIWDDPGPLVGIEALSVGTPVIGFAVGGIPDYVLHGETGYLVHDTTAQGLHNILQECLENTAKLPAMSLAGQKLVTTNHTRAHHMDKIKSIYKEVMNKKVAA